MRIASSCGRWKASPEPAGVSQPLWREMLGPRLGLPKSVDEVSETAAFTTTVNVTGFMLDGVGHGTATVKGKGAVPITVE